MYIQDHPISKLNELRVLLPKDLIRKGQRIMPETFYVHSFNREVLEEHHPSTSGYDMSHWDEWMKAGRIYIVKEQDLLI